MQFEQNITLSMYIITTVGYIFVTFTYLTFLEKRCERYQRDIQTHRWKLTDKTMAKNEKDVKSHAIKNTSKYHHGRLDNSYSSCFCATRAS